MKARRYVRLAIVATLFVLAQPLVGPADAVTSPSTRFGNAMATDPATGKVVMFGGGTSTTNSGETWTWNGSAWARPTPIPSPEVRKDALMAEDLRTGTIVLFGGDGGKNDTWQWNGTPKDWTEVTPLVSPRPIVGERMAMAYDGLSGKVVLFVGDHRKSRSAITGTRARRSSNIAICDQRLSPCLVTGAT